MFTECFTKQQRQKCGSSFICMVDMMDCSTKHPNFNWGLLDKFMLMRVQNEKGRHIHIKCTEMSNLLALLKK